MDHIVDIISFNGHSAGFLRFGTGRNTLVILPGLSVQSVLTAAPAIAKQYEIFAGDFTVYLFDRRSDLPERYTVYDMADDTACAMDALGLKNVCMFGTSQGGMIAAVTAIKRPDLVGKLAIASSACRIDKKRGAVISEWADLAKEGKAEELYLSFGEKVYPPGFFEKYRGAFVMMSKSVTACDLERFVILAEGTIGFDIGNELEKIKCPVLVTGDDTDAVLGADAAQEIARALKNKPDAELYMYSSYGHAAYDTAPDYKQRLYDFFTK